MRTKLKSPNVSSTFNLNRPFHHNYIIAFSLCAVFITLTLFRLHGYSITMWRTYIDDSEHKEVLLGRAVPIRSDDYLVLLPFNLAQCMHKPQFPKINTLIGQGQNMLLLPSPCLHWTALFRPQTWGYFLGMDYGLSWNWWFNVLGLLYSFFLVLMIVSNNHFTLSFLGSLSFLFSPFNQFWSLNSATIFIFAAMSFIAVHKLVFLSKSIFKITINSILFIWSCISFILCFYPPFQITLGWFFLALFLGLFFCKEHQLFALQNMKFKIPVLFLSATCVCVISVVFLHETRDVLDTVTNTVYPGQRSVGGGNVLLWKLFNVFFFPWKQAKDWEVLDKFGNISAVSSFFFFFPIIISCQILNRKKQPLNILTLSLLLYISLILTWELFGLPALLSKALLFNKVPAWRTILGLGAADITLLVMYLSKTNDQTQVNKRGLFIALSVSWFIFMIYTGTMLRTALPLLSSSKVFIISLCIAFFTYIILTRSRYAMPLFASLSILSSAWFNPLTKGSSEFIQNNELSKKIIELDQKTNNKSTWLVFNSLQLQDLPRMIGVKSLNGVHYYPQFDLWSKLDPEKKLQNVYNRYAHVTFTLTDKDTFEIRLPQGDVVQVFIHPDNPLFKNLGVDYILSVGKKTGFLDHAENVEEIWSMGDKHIFKVKKP